MADHTECWRAVVGWEGHYEVSCRGRVRGIDRWVTLSDGRRKFITGRVLRPHLLRQQSGTEYWRVGLQRPGRKVSRPVHLLVLTAFAGPPEPGQEARHGPGGSLDNRWPENLCWGTRAENIADRLRDGTDNRGERNSQAKLTSVIVLDCRRRRASGELVTALAAEYGVSLTTLSDAILGRTWAHLH